MIIIPRRARKTLGASFFHVIIQGYKKEFIFKKERYIYQYIKLINKYIKDTELKVIAYCIMGNHAHFLFKVKKIEELSKFFHKLNTMYARYYNYMENGRVGYVYRDRFLSEPITSHRYLIQCIKYIHFNPVKAEIVEKCEDYNFSSYKLFKERLEKEEYLDFLTRDDYKDICCNINYDLYFLDIEVDKNEIILTEIQKFVKIKNIKIDDIFLNRKILEELVFYLKSERNFKYTEISSFFGMTRGVMQGIINKNKKIEKDYLKIKKI